MVPTLETKISSPSAVIKIITDMQSKKNNVTSFDDTSRELEKGGREYKESSSTQTSSSSSLLHKRKANSYYVTNGFHKTMNVHMMTMFNRPRYNLNPTSQRIISAKLLRVKQLQSELIEAQKHITDLQEENRTLKSIYKKQDIALRKYESQDSHLPQLLKSHEEEIRVLTLKYKKIRSSYNDLESRHNKQFSELNSVKERYKHLMQISQDKHLLQRERLTKEIEEMKLIINDLNDKIKLQSRRLDLEVKNYKHQLVVEFQKQKSLREQLKQTQDTVQKLQISLEDRDRIIANCKMNHIVSNNSFSQTHLNSRIRTSPLRPIRNRFCAVNDQEVNHSDGTKVKINLNNLKEKSNKNIECTAVTTGDSSQTSKNDPGIIKVEAVINSESHNIDDEKLENSDDEDFFSGINFIGAIERKGVSQEIPNKSDSNNNTKSSGEFAEDCKDGLEDGKIQTPETEEFSADVSEFCEKSVQDEISSERSEDFRPLEDIVSWLEVHEKTSLDNHADLTTLINTSSSTTAKLLLDSTTQEVVSLNVQNKTYENSNPLQKFTSPKVRTDIILPDDKKSALLQALNNIDSEKKSTNQSPRRTGLLEKSKMKNTGKPKN